MILRDVKDAERAWFAGKRNFCESEASDPSAALPRWGKANVPEKAQTRQTQTVKLPDR